MRTGWIDTTELAEQWSPQVLVTRSIRKSLRARCETAPLGELASITSGRYVRDYVPPGAGAAAYLRVDNIRPYCANLNAGDLAYVDRNDSQIPDSARIRLRDVVIARTGTLGKASLAGPALEGAVASQHVTRLTIPSGASVSPAVLCAFLNSPPGRRQLLAGGSGSTRLELTHARLSELRIPILGDDVAAQVQRLVETGSADLEQSGVDMREAVVCFEQYLRPPFEWTPAAGETRQWVADLNGSWVPRYYISPAHEWVRWARSVFDLRPLGQIARIQRGKGTRVGQYADSGLPFVRTTSLINGGIDPFPDHYADRSTVRAFKQPTPSGTILLSIEGKIGEVAILTDQEQCAVKNHIEIIRVKDSGAASAAYLSLASSFGWAQLRSLTVVQATLPGLANRSRQVLVPLRLLQRDEAREESGTKARALLSGALNKRAAGVAALRRATELMADAV